MSSRPGFPQLLPTASDFPLSQLPPGQALTALNGAKASTTRPLHPFVCSCSRAQLILRCFSCGFRVSWVILGDVVRRERIPAAGCAGGMWELPGTGTINRSESEYLLVVLSPPPPRPNGRALPLAKTWVHQPSSSRIAGGLTSVCTTRWGRRGQGEVNETRSRLK